MPYGDHEKPFQTKLHIKVQLALKFPGLGLRFGTYLQSGDCQFGQPTSRLKEAPNTGGMREGERKGEMAGTSEHVSRHQAAYSKLETAKAYHLKSIQSLTQIPSVSLVLHFKWLCNRATICLWY